MASNFTRRTFFQTAGMAAAAPLLAQNSRELPNIVFVLADDLGWGDLPCNNPESAVPMVNANRLASQGTRFIDMHSSSAVCTPSRYSILTGRYCWRTRLQHGVLNGYSSNLIEPGRMTVPGMLKRAGYYTAGVGKWHLGLGSADPADFSKPLRPGPLDHGFDYYFGIPASLDMDPYLSFENDRVVEPASSYTRGAKEPRGYFWRPGACTPGFNPETVLPELTRKSVDLVHQHASGSRPFFLYFAMPSPHTPWVPAPKFRGVSKAGDYGDYVAEADDALGQVMRAVDANSRHNTIFVFTSDNGADWKVEDQDRYAHRANGDWKGEKADIWEGGHRIPFLVRWPNHVPEGRVSNELGCLSDFMTTVAAILGVKLPDDAAEDSYNLLPAWLGTNTRPIRPDIIHHSISGMFAIRRGNWKLEEGLGSGGFTQPAHVEPGRGGPKGQLYDMARDPEEKDNLYQKHPEIVDNLATLLEKYKQQGHTRPLGSR